MLIRVLSFLILRSSLKTKVTAIPRCGYRGHILMLLYTFPGPSFAETSIVQLIIHISALEWIF